MHQQPTHPRLHVRDVRDALVLLEAVRLGILKQVERRLNDAERSMYVRSGSVFVWEESDDDAGIKRWTDGCMWSQSRMREPFLFYEEKLQDDRGAIGRSRESLVSPSLTPLSHLNSRPYPPSGHHAHPTSPVSQFNSVPQAFSNAANSPVGEKGLHSAGLVKQAYSAYVTQPGSSARKKFHLTAYFTYADLADLPTLDSDPRLLNIVIPQGVYLSGKSRTSGRNLANAAEPIRARHGGAGGDSSPSPTSSPSSSGHSPLTQYLGSRRRSTSSSYYDPSATVAYQNTGNGYHATAVNHHAPYPGNTLLSNNSTHLASHIYPSETYASVPRLPPVVSLTVDSDAVRRNRNAEDNRVINMLNSRPIP